MFVAKAEAAKAEVLQQTPSAQWRILMAVIAGLSDKKNLGTL